VPRLWNDTIEAHRASVHHAILETTAALVTEHGLASVTMSRIAEATGIGRATLYKYFPDVDSILIAWHQQHVSGHLAYLAQVRDKADGSGERLEAVLRAYARIGHEQPHGTELAALVHRGEHLVHAQQHLRALIRDLLAEAAKSGTVRDDIAPDELAAYCISALTAAGHARSNAAVNRLVTLTLDGLRPRS